MTDTPTMELGEALEIFFRTPAHEMKARRFRSAAEIVDAAVRKIARRYRKPLNGHDEDLANGVLERYWRNRDKYSDKFRNQGESQALGYIQQATDRRFLDMKRKMSKEDRRFGHGESNDTIESIETSFDSPVSPAPQDKLEERELSAQVIAVLEAFVQGSTSKNEKRNQLFVRYALAVLSDVKQSDWYDEELQKDGKELDDDRARNTLQKSLGRGRVAFTRFLEEAAETNEALEDYAAQSLESLRVRRGSS